MRFATVDDFVAAQTPEAQAAVERLRTMVWDASPDVAEIIKWNSPSYTLDGEDRLTVNVGRDGGVRLVLHRGVAEAEVKDAASAFAGDPTSILTWHSDIRASMPADAEPDAATAVIRAWLAF